MLDLGTTSFRATSKGVTPDQEARCTCSDRQRDAKGWQVIFMMGSMVRMAGRTGMSGSMQHIAYQLARCHQPV